MNAFDQTILLYVNQYARNSKIFDLIAFSFQENTFLKGGVLASLFCYLWFKADAKQHFIRITLVATVLASFISVLTARILSLNLPHRPRPIVSAHIDFISPYFMQKIGFDQMSAFPSDHAALYCALSIGLFFASRIVGILAIAYAVIFILLPRIYTGMHHPTDIIAGALIGFASIYFVHRSWFMQKISVRILAYSEQYSGLFYVAYFLVLLQISTLFLGVRNAGRMVVDVIKLCF